MSRKLESKESHSFYVEDAEKYGVDKASILYNIRFWLNKELANYTKGKPSPGKVHDGYVWTYNTAEAFGDLIPYFTPNKIQKLLKQLENDGIIITGKFNNKRYDKTKWYTMEEYSVGQTLQPNGWKESAKRLEGISQTAEPIPDINTDKKPNDKLKNNVSNETEFESFWSTIKHCYKENGFTTVGNKEPARKAFKKAMKITDLNNLKTQLCNMIERKSLIRSKGMFTPNPSHVSTWLNNKGWTEELEPIPVNQKNAHRANGAASTHIIEELSGHEAWGVNEDGSF